MARHLHHHHHDRTGFFTHLQEVPLVGDPHPVQLKHVIESPFSHARSLFIRTPPGVGGSSSSSDSSESDSGGFDSESSGSTDKSEDSDSGFDSSSSGSSEAKPGPKGGTNISIPVALGVMYGLSMLQKP